MKRIKYGLFILSFIASFAVFSGSAQAASVYDEHVVIDTEIRVTNADSTCSQDVSTSYMSILQENPDFQTKWQSSYFDTGAWAVSTYYPGDGQKWVGFNFVADDANNVAQFQSRPGEPTPGISIANWDSNTDGSFYIRAEMQQDGCHYIPAGGFSSGQLGYKAGAAYDMRIVFSTFSITYPTGYEGALVPSEYAPPPATSTYVAMGDSYSSGLGSYNYDLAGGECKRSSDSYTYYLVEAFQYDEPYFAACAGAITDDLFAANQVNTAEDAQMNHLSDITQVVTMTIGGNDVGFAEIIKACADYFQHAGYGCATDLTMRSNIDNRLSALAETIIGTEYAAGTTREIHSIKQVLAWSAVKASNAKIYIAGYPRPFGSTTSNFVADSNAPGEYKCIATHGMGLAASFSYSDAQWMNSIADDLNAVISNAVTELNNPDIEYVNPSTFDGHGLCDSSFSYIHGIEVVGLDNYEMESFHPTVTGIEAGYGVAFANEITN